jgi:hypothetical protein
MQYRPHFAVSVNPSAAAGADGKTVYMAFIGIDQQEPENPDIFVAVSHDGGATFDPENTFRLEDSDLRLPSDATLRYQAMPSVAIDAMGGINLMWADTPAADDGPTDVTIRYARFNNTAALSGPASFIQSLTPMPFRLSSVFGIGRLQNDYHVLSASGCVLYAAYARTDPTNFDPHGGSIYVRRITIGTCATADVDGDSAVTSNDPNAFLAAFSTGSPLADVNMDDSVNSQDVVDFLAAYSAHAP